MYLIIFLVGAIGFFAMSLMGMLHGIGSHHAAHGHGHGHGLHFKGAFKALPKGVKAAGHDHSGEVPGYLQNFAMSSISLLSPLNVFSLCMGFGAAGLLLARTLSSQQLLFAAVAGALLFHFGITRQVVNLVFKFESKPSEGLESAVAKPVEAATSFDATGKGLVKLCLDGQVVQLLASLDQLDLDSGVRISKGDELVIVDVDATRNTCRVTRGLSP